MSDQLPLALANLAQKLYRVDDDRLIIDFHSGQSLAWDCTKRFVFVIAGTQGGKTSFGPFWLWREITWLGSGDYLAVTANYDLFKLKMLPEIRHVFEDVLGIARFWAGERILEIRDPETGDFWASRSDDPMWARVILRSAEAKEGLESSSAKAAWLDECGMPSFALLAWEAVQRRLSLSQGRVLGTTTPYNLGWLKTEIVDRWAQGDPDIEVIRFSSIANPAFPRAEYDRAQRVLPEWKFRMMYDAIFTRPAGMIYEDFVDDYKDNGGHKIKPFKIPQNWPRFVGVDPGAVHTAKVWVAHDTRENVFYVYRESLDGHKSTKVHAHEARDLATLHRERVIRWFVGSKSEVQQRLDWQAAGIRNVFEPPVADVESGIDSVIQLLKEFRIYFFDTCGGLITEILTYSRKLDKMNQPTKEILNKETFHRADALRYVSVGIQKRGVLFR